MTLVLTSSHISMKGVLCVVNKDCILKFCIIGNICHDMHNLFFPCLSTFAFCFHRTVCACFMHHVCFWAPGASPCSCNTIMLGWIPVGCCCACTFPQTWTNTNIFGILLTFFNHSCLGCHWLCMWRCMAAVTQTYCYAAVCPESQIICT